MYKLSPIVLFSFIILYNRIKNCMYKEGSVPMKTKLTYFGHSCFMLTRGDISMIFDPFLTGNTWDIAKREDIKCQYIIHRFIYTKQTNKIIFIVKIANIFILTSMFKTYFSHQKKKNFTLSPYSHIRSIK